MRLSTFTMASSYEHASSKVVSQDLPLCFIAEIITFCHLWCFSTFLSDLEVQTGIILSTPISTAFSRNHSNLSVCFVGLTNKVSFGEGLGLWTISFTSTKQLRFPVSTINASADPPLPSISWNTSPTLALKTLIA